MTHAAMVVDASVAIKWVLPEEGRIPALRLLDQYRDGQATLIAPRLLLSETASVLWKRVRRGDLTRSQATQAYGFVIENAPKLVDSPRVWASALQLALAHGQTVYDCLYLSLALDQQCDFITADHRFYAALGVAFPSIRSLD